MMFGWFLFHIFNPAMWNTLQKFFTFRTLPHFLVVFFWTQIYLVVIWTACCMVVCWNFAWSKFYVLRVLNLKVQLNNYYYRVFNFLIYYCYCLTLAFVINYFLKLITFQVCLYTLCKKNDSTRFWMLFGFGFEYAKGKLKKNFMN